MALDWLLSQEFFWPQTFILESRINGRWSGPMSRTVSITPVTGRDLKPLKAFKWLLFVIQTGCNWSGRAAVKPDVPTKSLEPKSIPLEVALLAWIWRLSCFVSQGLFPDPNKRFRESPTPALSAPKTTKYSFMNYRLEQESQKSTEWGSPYTKLETQKDSIFEHNTHLLSPCFHSSETYGLPRNEGYLPIRASFLQIISTQEQGKLREFRIFQSFILWRNLSSKVPFLQWPFYGDNSLSECGRDWLPGSEWMRSGLRSINGLLEPSVVPLRY
jgi:hypothetical protein